MTIFTDNSALHKFMIILALIMLVFSLMLALFILRMSIGVSRPLIFAILLDDDYAGLFFIPAPFVMEGIDIWEVGVLVESFMEIVVVGVLLLLEVLVLMFKNADYVLSHLEERLKAWIDGLVVVVWVEGGCRLLLVVLLLVV